MIVLELAHLDDTSVGFRALVAAKGADDARHHPLHVTRSMSRSQWEQSGRPTTLEVTL